MDFHQIEAFVNVAKYHSFSKAAKALYLSQPTISSHIKSLENELGVQLIVRTTKDVLLSDAGTIFYEYAMELIHVRDVATDRIQTWSREVKGQLHVAASTVPAQYVLPELLCGLRDRYPEIAISVMQSDSQSVISSVENFDAEVGITGMASEKSKCIFEPFLEDRLVLITPNTPVFQRYEGKFPVTALKSLPFVWRESGSGTRKEADAYLNSIGLSEQNLSIVTELPSTESVKQAVHHGLGVSIISQKAAEDFCYFGYLLAFDLGSALLTRHLYLVTHKNRILSPAAERFTAYLRERYSVTG